MDSHINAYYKAVCEAFAHNNIESAYYKPIADLLSAFGCTARDLSGERSGQSGENIDIKLWREGDDISETEPFAGVEAKKVGGIDNRATQQAKTSAQRYGNVILTDNLVWEFWHAGEEKMYAGVRLIERDGDKLKLREDSVELFISLVQDFMLRPPAQIRSSGKLAEYMAIHAKTIRSVIVGVLKDDGTGQPLIDDRQKKLPMFADLLGLYNKIKEELRPLLTSRSFADMYAQTIVYGLFIARYNDATSPNFDRYKAIGKLQEESALLNRFFTHIASTGKTHPTLETVIDKLCVMYQTCDISALLDQDSRRDTIVHFYEDFLTHYDPDLRKSLGVFYTPYQVVRYMVAMVDKLLVEEFDILGGLSNNDTLQIDVPSEDYLSSNRKDAKTLNTKQITVPRVAILDPACGTGTFHAEIIKYIKNTYFAGGREAFYSDYIRKEDGLLSRLIGFEIMMTSYVVAHLNIRRAIDETLGGSPEKQLPTNIYLTNTLAKPNSALERNEQMSLFDFSAAISEEAYNADTWKTRRPIKVIIGNPPYLGASTNPFDVSAYKTETDGVTDFGERKHGLSDDYVKFFRFAEQIINANNEGILAFVSNSSFLRNPTFRGMRASLLRTFDKIFVVDLHGNANKKETTPDGGKDENIFDIMQGVSLFIGAKTLSDTEWAKVFHCDLWGLREEKFNRLLSGVNYDELKLDKRMAYFIPTENEDKEAYDEGVSVTELFTVYVSGIQTNNDTAAVASTRDELARRIDIVKYATDVETIRNLWKKFSRGQSPETIQADVLSSDGAITLETYRPFDDRYTYYSGKSCGWVLWPREKSTMGHLMAAPTTPVGKNIGLVFARNAPIASDYAMIFVADKIIDHSILSTQSSTYGYIAPLYLHSELGEEWTPNINQEQLQKLAHNLTKPPSPIEVFDYCYGVLYDPVYREKYNEFLKRDFPRVPIIESEETFRAYVTAGERLRKLHLMQTKAPAPLTIEPATADNMQIELVKYKDGVLSINKSKRILGISEGVWDYRIGGYQVLDKWFKSHKGNTLTIDDFDHICNVVGLIAETIRVQGELREFHDTTNVQE